ncbi:unnamed protein product [Mycena citricolor]|uniref:SAP domain-containing protein n=1 Tax=Mycena citricolor TaxID=2018698 RepID=A0AAD2HP02_9AGAR|nr:unnamed protein product [Mycena citricolor]CAK5278450.1 unnamed protein product [Mycena citricolor]
MSTTTDILFNSPALHSLKRDQLVKLCKIHSIKANGKNVELVERLQHHAKTLPKNDPLSVAFRSEQDGDDVNMTDVEDEETEPKEDEGEDKTWNPRPSSQWELIMESITEESEGSSQGTLSSQKSGSTTLAGEFGSGSTSSKSVGSSIRALASSLGLKRNATSASISSRALDTVSSKASSSILSSFPLPPDTDELSKTSIPYDSLPPPAMDSLQTDHFTFDTSDPAVVAANLNPLLGTAPLPGHTLRPGAPAPLNARLSLGLAPRTPSKRGPTTTIRLVSFDNGNGNSSVFSDMPPPGDTPRLKPFHTTFDLDMGSPTATSAFPASIYPALPVSPPVDESERRMSLEVSLRGAQEDDDRSIAMPGGFGDEDIAMPGGSASPAPPFVFGTPSPSPATPFVFKLAETDAATETALAAEVMAEMNRRAGATSVPSREIRPLPGSARRSLGCTVSKPAGRFDKAHEQVFGKMESIVDSEARRQQQLKRKSSAANVRPEEDDQNRGKRVRVDEVGNGKQAESDDARKRRRESEAARKKIEATRARRRSSVARGSAVKPKAKPGRFGFLAGAAKLVQGVWGKKATIAPEPKPKPAPVLKKPAPPVVTKASAAPSLRAPSVRSVSSTVSRAPIPAAFVGTSSSKAPSSSASSIRQSGTMSSMGSRPTTSRPGSMGTRTSVTSSTKSVNRLSSSSRLLAPTASSLAKMHNAPPSLSKTPSALPSVHEKPVLDPITNSTGEPRSKGKLVPARKPRISRSRVIAKLASQRVASGSSVATSSAVVRKSLGAGNGRARSSLGVKAQRGSMGVMKNNGNGPLLDAKKRARQSEYYARRKSKQLEAAKVDS